MTKEPFWKRLGRALKEENEESAEDIDREVANAVKAIQEAEVSSVTTKEVFAGRGQGGGKIFIMDLGPIYAAIGARSQRLMAANKLICERVFQQHVAGGRGRFSFEGDYFVLRFAGLPDAEAFELAIRIVNTVGEQILGDRFHSMAVPALVIVAELDDVLGQDGALDAARLHATIAGGGIACAMEEPPATAPEWLRLRWKHRRDAAAAASASGTPPVPPSERVWQRGADGRMGPARPGSGPLGTAATRGKTPVGGQPNGRRELSQFAKRKGEDRRKTQRSFSGDDRRTSFDRRGRGY